VAIALLVLLAPLLVPRLSRRGERERSSRARMIVTRVRGALTRVRDGLSVFRQPRRAAAATAAQLGAWGLQLLAWYVLLAAFGLDHRAGLGAAAAVLFAVNLTAVLPATPANLGVFQAACVVVLTGAYHVSSASALGYGIVLQAVEIAAAVLMGMPALLNEGLSWRDMRVRTINASPVKLPAVPQTSRSAGRQAKARI
jgi:phosphatidylinositol alpha-mannosyltransferase